MITADAFRAATLILFALTLVFGGFSLPVVLAATFIVGLGQSLFRPSINSFLPVVVSKEQLGTANGLFLAAESVTGIIGGPLGGFLILISGVAATLLLNGASYVVSLIMIIVVARSLTGKGVVRASHAEGSFIQQVRAGLSYINKERTLLKLTIGSFAGNFFLLLFFTFLPVYVINVLAQNALVLGVIGASGGAGFGAGSLLVGRVHSERRFGLWYAAPWGVAGLCISGLVLFPSTAAAAAFAFVLGIFGGFGNTTFFTGVQMYVPNNLLGRYLSLDEVGSLAAGPAGQIAGGLIIAAYGINLDFLLASLGTAAFGFGLLLFPDVRRLKV